MGSPQCSKKSISFTVHSITCGLLTLFLTMPAAARNYQLHSPKLWTQQERELYEKENPSVSKESAQVEQEKDPQKKEREQTEKQRVQLRKERERIKKEKELIRRDQILVKDGVTYREVTVQKGDTLFDISRKFRTEGASYTETLRFNNIKDPNRIVSGDIIKVPLHRSRNTAPGTPPKSAKSSAAPVISAQPAPHAAPLPFSHNSTSLQKTSPPSELATRNTPSEKPVGATHTQPFANNSASRQRLYEQAITAYRHNDCQTAVQLFGRFLAETPRTSLAADISLFIADCYLKLSGK
ncbi:MAG: LysM peptidoglycan-binding domain-containing protein [Desulfuromonadaceae bacterium]|nr:LysM peptidoglycan-binding domain-containing protein [Desulfuromonadaceae bacterium]MDD5104072.1 LysM peptidoglycan-binding domain-containing protein [Desulfuromonadaceae bacterium]